MYLFERQSGRVTEEETERYSICWFTSQMAPPIRAEPGLSQAKTRSTGLHLGLPHRRQESSHLGSLLQSGLILAQGYCMLALQAAA